MAEPSTCGEGMAQNAEIPAVLAELTAALAETLEQHMKALDPDDRNAALEREAYAAVAAPLREAAARLEAAGARMAGCRDLPAAAHDMEMMTAAPALQAFERYVKAKQALLALLQRTAADDQQMLVSMVDAASQGPGGSTD